MTKRPRPICSIPDCTDPVLTLKSGWCSAHYQRAKSHDGDPLGGRARNGEVLAYFQANLMTIDTECKVWPYKTTAGAGKGYGQVWIDGRHQSVHVLACEAFNGPMPAPGMDATHGREKRCVSTLCFNGAHLKWDTRQGNVDMQIRDDTRNIGVRNGQARLTEADAVEVRRLYKAGTVLGLIATQFGISETHVRQIGRGDRWRHLS